MVWGISAALMEESVADHRFGRYINKSLAEVGMLGVATAVTNAFYHAISQGVRNRPITIDKLL